VIAATGVLGAAGSGRQLFNIADYGGEPGMGLRSATEAFPPGHRSGESRWRRHDLRAARGGTARGPIELFSNMTLEVDAGATIEFPVAELPFVKSRYLGVETLRNRCR